MIDVDRAVLSLFKPFYGYCNPLLQYCTLIGYGRVYYNILAAYLAAVTGKLERLALPIKGVMLWNT